MTQTKWNKRPTSVHTQFRSYSYGQEKSGFFSSPLRIFLFLLGFTLLIGGGFLFLNYNHLKPTTTLPIISPPDTPLKIRPKEGSSRLIPHQEKTIYQSLDHKKDKTTETKIVEKPEEPIIRPPALSENFFAEHMDTQNDHNPTESGISSKENITVYERCPYTLKGESLPSHPKLASIKYFVSFKGFQSHDEAESAWGQIMKMPAIKKDTLRLETYFRRVDLGFRQGIEHRILVGPFATLEKAIDFCKVSSRRCVVQESY